MLLIQKVDSRDSACGLESWILRRRLAHYRLDKSLRLRLENKGHRSAQADVSLENHNSSTTILESQNNNKKHPQPHRNP
ncbi:hypothetical protein [Helicobacter zhangjianzhongii]|uniref:Uncharacterized protein n=1 Tax=Helicobacter zhangjianzhongii TaxID=2974574 RepID=A0ACC6FTJ9_9HELI|nr:MULTISPECIES: hypothetical protein [unclassified Helicobacter]MDL0080389.1 hypothetical protein [Helicobacter sp. CPD2-1]MDL0082460.1 hypothetical protein [Helicobacter sp. XJK30-2]